MSTHLSETPNSLPEALLQILEEYFYAHPDSTQFEMSVDEVEKLLNEKGWSLDNMDEAELSKMV